MSERTTTPEVDPLWDRFWSKVDASGDCWEWTACRVRGYGQFSIGKGKRGLAHRLAWELLVGPIPADLELDHLCRNPPCVNPDHLEPVTAKENRLRSNAWSAVNVRKTHCPAGHEYTKANTNVRRGRRHCRICQRAYMRAWRARKALSDMKEPV